MKDDAPVPEAVPTKRRQLHDAPDYWLAVWASRELSDADRRRVEGERDRRKKLRKESDVTVGVIVGREGMTPEQLEYIAGYITTMEPMAICMTGVSVKLAMRINVPLVGAPDDHAVVRNSTVVIAAPKEPAEPTGVKVGVWDGIKYARHRRVPVRIVLPNGMEG